MFGSAILDVAIGLIFAFLVISLTTSSIIEAGASLAQIRSRTLLSGIQSLLNDPALVKALYNHALINPRNPGTGANKTKNNPAYVDPKQFAAALMDLTGISAQIANHAAAASPSPDAAANVTALKNAVAGANTTPQIKTLIDGIIDRSLGDGAKIKSELSDWFDNGMDRLSGLYKRWTQIISFVIALLLALSLNVDSVRIAQTLWDQPVLADKIKSDPEFKDPESAVLELDKTLPVGWPLGGIGYMKDSVKGGSVQMGLRDWELSILGWLITAFSTLFGAPFWFDALQRITRLKGSGPSPDEKATGRSASA